MHMRSCQVQDPLESIQISQYPFIIVQLSRELINVGFLSVYSVLAAQIVLLSPAFRWNSLFTSPGARSLLSSSFYLPRTLRTHTLALLSLIPLVALLSPLTRPPSPPPAPSAAHQRGRILNAGIWTVHFGIDDAGRDSQRRMRNLVRDMELDVFGLLETDLHRPVYGNRDL